jgi:hypothetical protein
MTITIGVNGTHRHVDVGVGRSPTNSAGDKIAVATLVGQRTDPQTAQFIKWFSSQPKPP